MTKSRTSYDNVKAARRGVGRMLLIFQLLLSSSGSRWAPLPLRLIVGYGFAEHGFAKLLRGAGNFAAADTIREALTAAGFDVSDTPEGTRWQPTGTA